MDNDTFIITMADVPSPLNLEKAMDKSGTSKESGFYTLPHSLEVGPSQNPRRDIQIHQAEQGGSECLCGGGGKGSDSDPPSSNVVIYLSHVLNSDPHLGLRKDVGLGTDPVAEIQSNHQKLL